MAFPVLALYFAASNISTTIILFSRADKSAGDRFNSLLTATTKKLLFVASGN